MEDSRADLDRQIFEVKYSIDFYSGEMKLAKRHSIDDSPIRGLLDAKKKELKDLEKRKRESIQY